MLTKTFPLKDAAFEKLAAEDDTLTLINHFALRPLSPDEVYIRRMILANDALDRDHERFSPEVLEYFAQTLPGKAFLVGHQHGSAPIGRFFHAEVLPATPPPQASDYGLQATGTPTPEVRSPESGARSLNLLASFYTIRTKDNEGFRQQIDGGVYSSVSIGFRCEKLVCDICGKDMKSTLCPHYPGKAYNGATASGTWQGQAEALEASLVYLGAQFGAQFVKSPTSDYGLQTTDSGQTTYPLGSLPSAPALQPEVRSPEPEVRSPEPEVRSLEPEVGSLKSGDRSSPWDWDWKSDADAIIEALGWHGLALACAYKDPDADPETKAAYKLPHHKLVDGKLTLFYRGVTAAMAALLGARGGTDIPEDKRRSVYSHLAAHYRQFNEEGPEFKWLAACDLQLEEPHTSGVGAEPVSAPQWEGIKPSPPGPEPPSALEGGPVIASLPAPRGGLGQAGEAWQSGEAVARSAATWQSPAGGGKTPREHTELALSLSKGCSPTHAKDQGLETKDLQTDSQPSTPNSQLKALEALLEQKERLIDNLSELAAEAKILRSDLISQILSKSQLIGLPSLFDAQGLADLPLPRLKSLLSNLNQEFDRKFPPQGLTTGPGLQAPGSSNTHPRSPESGVRGPDLSPFRLPKS